MFNKLFKAVVIIVPAILLSGCSSSGGGYSNPEADYSREDSDTEVQSHTEYQADKDCSDFSTQQEAQDFFIEQGGPEKDPHKLDRDKDGIACESIQ